MKLILNERQQFVERSLFAVAPLLQQLRHSMRRGHSGRSFLSGILVLIWAISNARDINTFSLFFAS
jgi:hypothetical protein